MALAGRLRVVLRSKDECAGDRRLEEFRCEHGPAAHEVRLILENLQSGEALQQSVAMLEAEVSGELVGIASVRLDGNAQIRGNSSVPWFLRRLASNPYVNLIARDDRYRGHVLSDGRTRLGSAVVRAALEVLACETGDMRLPTAWALVRRGNEAGKRALREFAFYPHDRSRENQQDVFVRRAGRSLPPAPAPEAYRALAPAGDRRLAR